MCFKTRGLFKCGKCPECLQERRLSWSLRLIQEWRETNCFSALLTYSQQHVPFIDGQMSLRKRDVQLFLKRLRHCFDEKVTYFIAAEYSPEKFRPHYHCLFFGLPERYSANEIKEILQKTWKLGFVGSRSNFIRSSAQINYTTGYLINLYEWKDDDKRERPFNLISKGLATSFHPDKNNIIKRDYNPFSIGWTFYDGQWHFNTPLNYDIDVVSLDDDIKIISHLEVEDYVNDSIDVINIQSEFYSSKKRVTTLGKVNSFPMPRIWREKAFTYYEREMLNYLKFIKKYKELLDYEKRYGEYDKNTDFPMWKQLKFHKWNQRKKSKKDKLLSDPETYFL